MEPDSLLRVADLLQRGLEADTLSEVVPNAIADLRALADSLRAAVVRPAAGAPAGVLSPADFVTRAEDQEYPFHFCVAATTGAGKSYLVAAIARAMVAAGRVVQVIVLSTNPITAAETYSDVCDRVYTYPYSPENVRKLLAMQEKMRLAGELPTPTLVVFDDIAATDIAKDKGVQRVTESPLACT
jgi:hypothetical protein